MVDDFGDFGSMADMDTVIAGAGGSITEMNLTNTMGEDNQTGF